MTPKRCTLPNFNSVTADGILFCRDMDGEQQLARTQPLSAGQGRVYLSNNGLLVIISITPSPHGNLLHVSFSFRDRLPGWTEIKAVRKAFYPPDVDVMQVLPREDNYCNLMPYTLHLWETPERWEVGTRIAGQVVV